MSRRERAHAVSYAELVAALVAGRLGRLQATRGATPFSCPSCGREATRDVLVRRLGRVGCPECVPRVKTCARCGVLAPIERFASPCGHLAPACPACRRERERERYAARRRTVSPTSDPRTCTRCAIMKPAREFCPNPRYRGGRMTECRDCRRERRRAYERTPRGRAVRRRIARAYRARAAQR